MGGPPLHETGHRGFPRTGGAATDGRLPRRSSERIWEYTLAAAEIEEAGFDTIYT